MNIKTFEEFNVKLGINNQKLMIKKPSDKRETISMV